MKYLSVIKRTHAEVDIEGTEYYMFLDARLPRMYVPSHMVTLEEE